MTLFPKTSGLAGGRVIGFIAPARWITQMDAFFISTSLVALAEMGDRTQLLALLLAARFRKPVPIIFAILLATLLNHALAAALGHWFMTLLNPNILRWILGVSFLLMAAWMLIPDKLDEDGSAISRWQKFGVFGATFVLFFIAEIGDKTQFATVALAARFNDMWVVLAGTTLGMMLANVPAVFIGHKMADKLPLKWIHGVAALIYAGLGVMVLLGGASWMYAS